MFYQKLSRIANIQAQRILMDLPLSDSRFKIAQVPGGLYRFLYLFQPPHVTDLTHHVHQFQPAGTKSEPDAQLNPLN